MSGPDHSENVDELRDLADARFYDWCSRELRSEEHSRFAELNKKKFTGGRALHALRITQELLTRKVRKRISLYHSIARKNHSEEMLSKPRLDEFREGIMRSVGASLSSLRSRTRREANAVGYPQSALPSELRYDHVRAEILTIVNTALASLNAEGNVHAALPVLSAPAPVPELTRDSSAVEERVAGTSRMPAPLSPAERLRQLAAHPFIRDTETRASLEFHRCAHENQAKWWVIEKQAYLIYPRHPSAEELLEALKNPADTLDATLGEMAAANYAATIIQPIVNAAMSSIQGPELETFIQECARTYTEKACKLLRPASENEESRGRVGHFVDLAVTTALTSIRMVSHVQAAMKNGMKWEEVARLVPRRSAQPDDVLDDEIETPAPESPNDWRASEPLASDGPKVTDLSAAARHSRLDLVEVPHFTPSPFTSEFWDAFREASDNDKRGILKQWLANRETAPDGSEAANVLDDQIGQLTAALTNGSPPVLDSAAAQTRPREGAAGVAGTLGDIGESVSNAARFRVAGVDPVAQERRVALLEFKAKGRAQGIKITDKMVAHAADPNWNDRSMVQWWKRNYEKGSKGCKPPHDRMIRAVLSRDPATIWQPGTTKPETT